MLAIAAILGGAGVVQALDNPLAPDIVRADGSFYSSNQIDEVWRSITESYPAALPAQVKFPVDAPSFFHPAEEGKPVFQTGLPELIAARYWRCAWLDVALDGADRGNRSSEAAAHAALGAYAGLPAVRDLVDVKTYELQISEYAKLRAAKVNEAEFTLECGIYMEAGNVR